MKELRRGISVFVPAYNEEKRIDFVLTSLQWCDEVILVDKESTDNTVALACKYSNVIIVSQKNTSAYSSSEFKVYLENCHYTYTMTATCSDIIHPELALEIQKLIKNESFDFDAIRLPYKGYFLGIYENYSPWYAERGIKVVKLSTLKINENEVHTACMPQIKSIYDLYTTNKNIAFYHLTHETPDGMIDRHLRYWRGEASSPEPLNESLIMVIRKTIRFLIIKRTFFKGKAAIALAFSFLSYYMISYIYKWDHLYGNGIEEYEKIRREISNEWTKK